MYTYIYVCMHVYVYIYIYICVVVFRYSVSVRELRSKRKAPQGDLKRENTSTTPSPPTKSLEFRGFDSSRLLMLRGGNSHVR